MSCIQKRGSTWYIYYYDEKGKYRGKSLGVTTKRDAIQKQREFDASLDSAKLTLEQRLGMWMQSIAESHEAVRREATNKEKRQIKLEQAYAEKQERLQAEQSKCMLTMNELWEKYEAWAKDGNRSRNTLIGYRTAFNKFTATVPIKYVHQIDKDSIDYFTTHCQKKGSKGKKPLQKSGIIQYLIALQGMIGTAIEQGWYTGNAPINIPWQSARTDRVKGFLDEAKIERLMKEQMAIGEHNGIVLCALGSYAGLRKDEIANLLCSEVDLDRRVITVQAHTADPSRGIEEFSIKGKRIRTIPVSDKLAEILLSVYDEDSLYWIVPPKETKKTHDGRFRHKYNPPQSFYRAIKQAGLEDNEPNVSPHLLRHSFASNLAIRGTSIFKISRWLGHATVKITEDIYVHLHEGHDPDVEY